jgi:acyl-CoA synthetase (AMP-forming)/AMP-acid ligase II
MQACIHPDGDVHTPYGATESLPVASISASEVLTETRKLTDQGAGVCVGRRFPAIDWKVIRIVDRPIPSMDEIEELPPKEIGELIVRGPQVTREYATRTQWNARSKIADGDSVWHRIGDAGYLDAQERFWFCGRVAHRVLAETETMFTVPCEAVFNCHPKIYRSALVGVGPAGRHRPVLIAEPHPSDWPRSRSERARLIDDLKEIRSQFGHTSPIRDFLLHRGFPVDIRHNAKIFREKLAVWAATRLESER